MSTRWVCSFCYQSDTARHVMPIDFLEVGFNEESFCSSTYYAHPACIQQHFDDRVGFSRKKEAFVDLTDNSQYLVDDPPPWRCCFCYRKDAHENVRIAKVIKTGRTPKEQTFAAHPKCITNHFDKRMGIIHQLNTEGDTWMEKIENEVFKQVDGSPFENHAIELMNMIVREATSSELRAVLLELNEKDEVSTSDYQVRKALRLLRKIAELYPMPESTRYDSVTL